MIHFAGEKYLMAYPDEIFRVLKTHSRFCLRWNGLQIGEKFSESNLKSTLKGIFVSTSGDSKFFYRENMKVL